MTTPQRFLYQQVTKHGRSCTKSNVVSAVLVSFFVVISLLGINSEVAGSAAGIPAWHARIVVPGDFSGLMSADGSLYTVKYATHGPLAHGSRLVRVDPVSGRILAKSPVLPSAAAPIYADHAIWLSGATFFAANARSVGPAVLFKVNPLNLTIESRVRIDYPGYPTILGGPKGIVWGEWRNQTKCVLRRINSATGIVMTSDTFVFRDGGCVGATLDTTGSFLYVATTENTSGTMIYKLNGRTGTTISRLAVGGVSNFESMVAVRGHLWMADGDPGAPGGLQFLTTSPLRLIAESKPVDTVGTQNLGPHGYVLPDFGQFPSIDLSGGILWVGSDGGIACFMPSNQRTVAFTGQTAAPIVTDSFVRIDDRFWVNAAFDEPSPDNGLARIYPPAACAS